MSRNGVEHDPAAKMSFLEERNAFLEENLRWYGGVLDLLHGMADLHADREHRHEPSTVLRTCREQVLRLHRFDTTAFYAIDERDARFTLTDCLPAPDWTWVDGEVDALIARGDFAWALHRASATAVPSADGGRILWLHPVATRARVRGMFVGVTRTGSAPPAAALQVLSVILQHTAHALESAALYGLLNDRNSALERLLAERTQALAHHIGHDQLTGLPNRGLFQDRLEQGLRLAARYARRVAVLLLDLDQFRRVNDSLGHAAGDAFLLAVASRLQEALAPPEGARDPREPPTLARFGGDEFGAMLYDAGDPDDVLKAVERVLAIFGEPIAFGDEQLHGSAALGVAVYPDDGDTPEALLRNAESAMYQAKRHGRNRPQFYSAAEHQRARDALQLENELRRALDLGELVLHFQPQVDGRDGACIGAEALVRWRHPERGLLLPGAFIGVAEESGLIEPLGQWVLDEACRAAAAWPAERPVVVAVNLSAQQLRRPALADEILDTVRTAGLPPGRLEVELTESALIENMQEAVSALSRLRAAGVRVAIDDFGTGYSSLRYLQDLPIDTLKIDRSYVARLGKSPMSDAIVRAIAAMARELRLGVVAEGVETDAQRTWLLELPCDRMQGFLFSRALPPGELRGHCARHP